MADVVPVRLKGKLKEIVDTLVSTGIYGSKSEVIRSGIRRIGEEHGLINVDAKYHIRKLRFMTQEKSPEETMEKLEQISEEIWAKRKRLHDY